MPEITAIVPQKKSARVNIFLDGKFAFGLSLSALAATGLASGQTLSLAQIETIIKKEELAK
ncbi:hypothetical protein HYZ70_01455, partial [Candidatus Curtissbacteria bacterium]|nr:hypothetical protein [Candidatus Curtissbacteria bacterium]